jgi:hypothetical protein
MTSSSKLRALAAAILSAVLGASCSGGEGTCAYAGKTYAYGQGFMDTDGCNSCTCSAPGVACTERACFDGGNQDVASNDGASGGPAGGTCALAETYRFGPAGGLMVLQGESTLSPPDHYRHVRMIHVSDGLRITECSPALAACGAEDVISLLDITRDLADADVRAAFAMSTPPFYGVDTRPVDGPVYSVTRGDGRGLVVGGPCGPPAVDCRAIPRGVQALVDQLRMLDAAQLAKSECASLAKLEN